RAPPGSALDRERDVYGGAVLADPVVLDDRAHRNHVRAGDAAQGLGRLLHRRVGCLGEALWRRTDDRDHLGDVGHGVSFLSIWPRDDNGYLLKPKSRWRTPRSSPLASCRRSSSTSTPTRKMMADV